MSESSHQKPSSHPYRKKLIRVATIFFMTLLFLEFVVYFGSNIFLSKWAERKINEATKDVYLIEFNRFNFSLIRRGIFLNGVVMKPIDGTIVPEDQTLFNFSLDQLAIRNLWYSFSEGVLYVGKIKFDNPVVKLDLPDYPDSVVVEKNQNRNAGSGVKTKSPIKELEEEIQKSIGRLNFGALFIREIEISHADLFFFDFLSQNSLKAENTSLIVKDINWTEKEIWKTPFNARGFEFDLENVDFPLPDGVHSIHADKVFISSLDKLIDIKEFQITANKSNESNSYYDVHLDKLRVGNVDLNKAFMTSEVEIDELILNAPEFKVEQKEKIIRDNVATGDLNELISGILKSIEIKELSINNGKFIRSDYFDSLKNRVDIEGLEFKMVKFYLGEDQARKENQFFYGEDASMEITDANLYLADEIHVLKGDKVIVSSFKDEILIQNFSIQPLEGSLLKNPGSLINLTLPEFSLEEVDLKKLYNEGILDIGQMQLLSPQIEYTELTKLEKTGANSSNSDLLKGLLNSVSIKRFDLQNGVVQFKDDAGARSNDIGFEQFSLLLENIFLQPGVSTKTFSEFLLADEIVLSLDKYRLKLKDNLHEFLADRVLIDSKNSLVEITGFVLRPENQGLIKGTLDAYGKSSTIDLKIPKFRAEGIDLNAAFIDQELFVKQISIPNPELILSRYRKTATSESPQATLESSKEFEDLLTSYFRSIQIDSLNFSDGKIQYSNYSGREDISFNEDKFSLILRGFLVDKDLDYLKERTFFSEEIDLSLENYSFSLAGGNYVVETDGLSFNSVDQSLKIENLVLSPGSDLNSKIALSLTMPSVSLDGIDIETFLFDNELILEQFNVLGGKINLEINPDFQKVEVEDTTQKAEPNSRLAIRKTIETLKIDELNLEDSKLIVNYRFGDTDVQSIQTDFDLIVKELYLDSATNHGIENLSELYKSINLNLEDFSFALPDSIHTIQFSNLAFDNLINETLFSDLKIIPSSKSGNPGSMVIEASIDQLGIQNNKLKEIQETGIFDLSQVRLTNPDFNIYIDSERQPKEESPSVVEKKDAFVNSLLLQNVLIQNGKFVVHNKETGPISQLDFQGVNMEVGDLNIDLLSTDSKLKPELLLQKDLNLSFRDYHIYTKDSLNKLSVGKISYLDNNVILESVNYGPTIGQYDYLRRIGYQSDAISASVGRVTIEDLDIETFYAENRIRAHALKLDNVELDVFRDKRLPLKEGVIKPMPQQMMLNSSVNLELDSVILRDGILSYIEFGPKSMLPGTISFQDLNVSLTPFYLVKEGEEYPVNSTHISTTGKLMGEGDMVLKGEMFFEKPYPMDVNINMDEFDLRLANNLLSTGTFVRILDGRLTDGKWKFTMDEKEAIGDMDFLYEDLKIEFLDSLTLESGRGKLGLYTFLANLVTKKSNPRSFWNHRVNSSIYLERDESKFVFGTWMRATFSGIKGSVGLGKPKPPKRREED